MDCEKPSRTVSHDKDVTLTIFCGLIGQYNQLNTRDMEQYRKLRSDAERKDFLNNARQTK